MENAGCWTGEIPAYTQDIQLNKLKKTGNSPTIKLSSGGIHAKEEKNG